MLKNIVITILTIIVVLFWLGADSDENGYDDPDAVVIEYKCSTLSEYDQVPTEVIEECLIRYRQLTKNTI
jgi:hypothetical protein